MWRLLFLSSISGVVATGCSDDSCGPGSAPDFGLLASSADVTLNYGNMTSGANNDCPDPSVSTSEVVSLTIEGTQKDGTSIVTFCLPRPDLLQTMDLPLATTGVAGLRIIDFTGEADGCTFTFEPTRPPTGNAHAVGMCDNGTNAAGWALAITGNISLIRTCPTMTDTIAVTLDGTVAVSPK